MKYRPRPTKKMRAEIRKKLQVAKEHFVLDPALVTFYHKGKKRPQTIAVTAVKRDNMPSLLFAARCAKHSNDLFYGPAAELVLIRRLNKIIREEINAGTLSGVITQVSPAIPRTAHLSETVWMRTTCIAVSCDAAMWGSRQIPEIEEVLKDRPASPHRVKPREPKEKK